MALSWKVFSIWSHPKKNVRKTVPQFFNVKRKYLRRLSHISKKLGEMRGIEADSSLICGVGSREESISIAQRKTLQRLR